MAKRDKDIEELVRQVQRLPGWRVEDRPKGWRIWPADTSKPAITLSHGPRIPYRAIRYARQKLRNAGAEV
jgi:hypothetical protein